MDNLSFEDLSQRGFLMDDSVHYVLVKCNEMNFCFINSHISNLEDTHGWEVMVLG